MTGPTPETTGPSADVVRDWTGHRLDDVTGAGTGKIEGAFAEPGGGQARWLLARMGRFGHYTLVPARDAVEAAGHVWVPYTRDQIRRGPRVEPKATLDASIEPALIAHYGLPDYG